jgi:hypothetical protein
MFRFRWQTFVGIALLLMVPALVVVSVTTVLLYTSNDWYTEMANMFRSGEFENPLPRLWPSFAANLVISFLVGIVSFVTTGALTSAGARTYTSEPTSVGAALRDALSRLRTLVGVLVLSVLITYVIVLAGVIVGLALFLSTATGGQIQPGPLVFFGLIVFVAAFAALVFVGIRLALTVPVVMLESVGTVDAIRRSWRLVAGSSWRVLGYLLVFGLLIAVTGGVLSALINIIINPVRATGLTTFEVDPVRLAISTFIQGVIAAALEPITAIGTLLLYYDLRWRHGESAPAPGSTAPAPPMMPTA